MVRRVLMMQPDMQMAPTPGSSVAHAARQRTSNQQARTTFRSSIPLPTKNVRRAKGTAVKVWKNSQWRIWTPLLILRFDGRMVHDDSNDNTILPHFTSRDRYHDRCCCRSTRWGHGNICMLIFQKSFSTDNAISKNKVADHGNMY